MKRKMRRLLALSFLVLFLCLFLGAQETGRVFPDYLTPQMFGAKGDGKRDDTDALRKALYESSVQGKILYFPSGQKYKVSGTLNFYKGEYQNLRLNMMGCIPIKRGSYVPQEYGGVFMTKGVKLFQNAIISGSIERMCITGQRDPNVHFFNNCDCRGLVITGSNISNVGALFFDSKLHSVSQITQNTFLTLYYFARNEKTTSGMTDSTISFNYINGGEELNDNTCFEWSYFNGSTISNNFIDYYRTVYCPKALSKQVFVGPLSYSNQYQVFRYFYAAGPSIISFTFSSSADSFNWNDPETLEKLKKYKSETYKGKDGRTYEIPPYVACCNSTWNITISDAKIERNMKALVFVASSLTEYEYSRFDVSFIGNNQYKKGQINFKKGDPKPFYNSGKYQQNTMKIKGIVEVLDRLPQFGVGWSNTVHGRTVQVGDNVYRAVNRVDGKNRIARWEEVIQGEDLK